VSALTITRLFSHLPQISETKTWHQHSYVSIIVVYKFSNFRCCTLILSKLTLPNPSLSEGDENYCSYRSIIKAEQFSPFPFLRSWNYYGMFLFKQCWMKNLDRLSRRKIHFLKERTLYALEQRRLGR
jgi:hypothetical protein